MVAQRRGMFDVADLPVWVVVVHVGDLVLGRGHLGSAGSEHEGARTELIWRFSKECLYSNFLRGSGEASKRVKNPLDPPACGAPAGHVDVEAQVRFCALVLRLQGDGALLLAALSSP